MTTLGEAINALQEAILAIQHELGISPSTVYSNVRARLDILEKRMSNQLEPSPNVENPFIIGSNAITIRTGPVNPITLSVNDITGSLYLSEDGYGVYYRRDGYWDTVNMEEWVGAGDLSGNYASQTVIGIQGNSVSTNTPLDGYRLTWNESDGYWEPQIGFTAAGDLSGVVTQQTVIGIQGNAVQHKSLLNNDIYIWNESNSRFEPEQLAVIFDPIHDGYSTNIRSNRLLSQSPIDNTKIGVVNFGSDSDLSSTGVTGNYSSILGGNLNQVTSNYSSVVDGYMNSISLGSDYSSILGGSNNLINSSVTNSSIIGGHKNTLNASRSLIGDGYNNSVSGTYGTILSGNSCVIGTSNYSLILSGAFNVMTFDSHYSFIGTGHNNTITGAYSGVITGRDISIYSDDSVVLHGVEATINSNSLNSIILSGENSTITGKFSLLNGSANTISTAGDGYNTILNGFNNGIESNYSLAIGNNNDISGDSDYSYIFGSFNAVNITDALGGYVTCFGNSNAINSSYSLCVGNDQVVDGYYSFSLGYSNDLNNDYTIAIGHNNTVNGDYSVALGLNNRTDLNYGYVVGNKGRAKFNNQKVHSARAIDSSNTAGASQQSNIILDGRANAGASFNVTLPGTLNNLALDNNKSYDINVRILIVTESGTYACARFVYDILAHVSGNIIVLDNATETYFHSSGAPANLWSVTIGSSGNELTIQVDNSGVLNRRAIATVEWRELLRT